MFVEEFFESIYRVKRLRGKSQQTVRLYRSSMRNLNRTLGKIASISDITEDNIGLVMQTMLDRGLSPASANKERSQLLAIGRLAHKLGHLERWPEIAEEKEPERVPLAWLAQDLEKLLEATKQMEGMIGKAPAALFWECLVRVCLDTGERIGSVLAADWNDLEHRWLLARAEARKGGRIERKYMLTDQTVGLLNQLKQHTGNQGRIFAWPLSPTYFWTKYKKVLEKAGLPTGRKCALHRLRKTVASVAHASGLDAQELLGHSHRRVTQAYLDPRFTRQQQASEVLAKYLADPSLCHRDRESKADAQQLHRGKGAI